MHKPSAKTSTASRRLAIVDVARGFAIALMFAFHFCFDLNYFGVVALDFYHDPFWLHARTVILTLFLLVMGISLSLAHTGGVRWAVMRRRLLQLGMASAGVTLGTYLLFPRSYIFFGVLHFILVASLLARPFLHRRWLALISGAGLLWLGVSFSAPLFNQPWLQWFGLMTYKPITEDYVPLLPWLGVVLLGVFSGSWLRRPLPVWLQWQPGHWSLATLQWAGRHSLLLYLLHQPLFLALLYLLVPR